MSHHLTHVLRSVRGIPQFLVKGSVSGGMARTYVLTYEADKAQRYTRKDAEEFQRLSAGWYEAVPLLQVIGKAKVWGSKQSQEIHR